MMRYFDFELSFKLRWCGPRDLLGSQIPVVTVGFELWISWVITSCAKDPQVKPYCGHCNLWSKWISSTAPTPAFRKVKTIWNKDAIIPVLDLINKILLCKTNYIVGMVMWLNLGNTSISMREVIKTYNCLRTWSKKAIFWGVIFIKF